MRKIIKKAITVLFCIVIVLNETYVFASGVTQNNNIATNSSIKSGVSIGESGGYLYYSLEATKNLYLERKFTTPKGHGFAAERANNLIDSLTDYNFLKYKNEVPDINAVNSPDRKIINRSTKQELWIQDKYYSNANNTVNSAFDKTSGMYKYYDKYNKPMTLEVPTSMMKQYKKWQKKFVKGKSVEYLTLMMQKIM